MSTKPRRSRAGRALRALGLLAASAGWGQADDGCPVTLADPDCLPGRPGSAQDPSCDPLWALRQIGALEAAAQPASDLPGAGVTVAHIDVGIAQPPPEHHRHPELEGARFQLTTEAGEPLPLDRYSECKADANCAPRDARAEHEPIDALRRRLALATQPGHGTRTSSVLVSPVRPGPFDVRGIAPGVRLLPYMVTGGTILTQGRMLQAADAFVAVALEDRLPLLAEQPLSNRVDVLSISMGIRSPDPELEAALRLAERNGIVVVAAAGQGPLPLSSVRFPAQYPGAVAVTGTAVDGRPWRISGRGPAVAVAAPAYGVWRGDWKRQGSRECPVVGRGRGTSFATPLVAGAAALWIQKHGRARLDQRYGRAAVPAAFRYWLTHRGYRTPEELCALARTSQQPGHPADAVWPAATVRAVCPSPIPRWDEKRRGVGILAVDKLLADRLEDLPDARTVCAEVYRNRGPHDWDMVCPVGSPGRTDVTGVDELLSQPTTAIDHEARTWVNGVSLLGKPFGGPLLRVSPAISYGVIFSDHHRKEPNGPILQVQAAPRAFRVGAGWVHCFEYSPFGHSRRFETGRIPGFGPTVGLAFRGAYMRTLRTNFVGPEIEVAFYRVKLELGHFWAVGSRPAQDSPARRFTVSLGTGF